MNPMTKVYAIVIGALLLVIALVAGGWYISSLRSDVATAKANQVIAEGNVSTCASALKQADDATASALAKAEAYRSQAQTIIDAATTQKGKNTAAGTVFASKLTTSATTADCQSVLEAQLCPALSGY
jgi:hypothetical protein